MGLNPGRDTCVLEQDTVIASLHPGYKRVPAKVEVEIVYKKAIKPTQQLRPYDQGTNVKRIDTNHHTGIVTTSLHQQIT